ncbi:MAG: GIY-YIG nuclease family protein [Candidatus Peribacteraceae bacterium]|nr:GIY-YIG nuclease family protein [Candidatus Peribacteraceae bacterium]
MPFFYLARCSDNSLYSGSCKDLAQREAAHNAGKGAKYTRSRLPVRIVYHEKFPTLADAMRREAQVKRMKKEEKERLLQRV